MTWLRCAFRPVLAAAVLFAAATVAGDFAHRLISPAPLSASECEYDLCFNWLDEGECVDFGKPPFSSNCNMEGQWCEQTRCQ